MAHTMVCFSTQVLQWVMSYDNENATEALAITAASAALAVSGAMVGMLDLGPCQSETAGAQVYMPVLTSK